MKRSRIDGGTSRWAKRRHICKETIQNMEKVEQWLGNTSVPLSESEPSIDNTVNDTTNATNVISDNDTDTSSVSSWYSFEDDSSTSSDSTSKDDSQPVEVKSPSLSEDLGTWSSDFSVTHSSLGALLAVLRRQYPESHLPKDPRTLLKTIRSYEIQKIAGGEYHHFGLTDGILESLSENSVSFPDDQIVVQYNIDGIPIFKSSKTQFWPILCRVVLPKVLPPFAVGIYSGQQKPTNIGDYLREFVDELKQIEVNGLPNANGKVVKLKTSCFICDAPARAFIKQVKGHNAYHGCERCTQKGQWNDKVTFSLVNAPLRTDESFNERLDEDHHQQTETPLCSLPIGLVSQVVLDPMHLVHLGVMRKLLKLWMKGPKGLCRLGPNSVLRLSEVLVSFHSFIPREFNRKCRSLSEVDRWKATEYRQFLLYSGIVVLKDHLSKDMYSHFLKLYVAIFCMSSPVLHLEYLAFSKKLLVDFVSEFSHHYGRNMLVYNVHNLVHLGDDVQNHGVLDSFSAFCFENFLGSLKKMLRKPQSPLAQVVRRFSEKKQKKKSAESVTKKDLASPWNPHNNGPLPLHFQGYSQFSDICCDSIHFSVRKSDNCVQVGLQVGLIRNIVKSGSDIKFIFEPFRTVSDFFKEPLPSSTLDIYVVANLKVGSNIAVSFSDIKCKYVRFPYKNVRQKDRSVVIPLVHQFH